MVGLVSRQNTRELDALSEIVSGSLGEADLFSVSDLIEESELPKCVQMVASVERAPVDVGLAGDF